MASLEFASANAPPQHSLYGQPDIDPSYNLSGSESSSLDAPDHPSDYGIYNNSNGQGSGSFSSQRYRPNGSSSSSMGHNFGLNSEGMYPQSSFGESVPSFASSNQYDIINNGSYGSGKASPLTPSDPTLQHGGPFPPPSNQHYHDVPDRRLSMNPNGYHPSEYPDEYSMNGMNNGMHFGHQSVPQFQDRLTRYPPDRYNHPPGQQPMPPHIPPQNEMMGGISPHATHSYDRERGYDNMHYMNPNPHQDMALRMPSTVDETLARMKLQAPPMGGSNDLQTFIRPFLDQYVRTQNRLAFGERTIIVMSSKVAQKSYGTEKRFLCPPPTAILIGNSWWSEAARRGEEPKLAPPRVVVSISGEPAPQEGSIEWTSTSGKSFDVNDPPAGTTYLGRCVGKQLFISDVDEKKKKVEALVKVTAPATDDEPERVIGIFPSRPIKVISKPSKKRQSAKNLESFPVCINHGSTISLFHRLRSQTVSTKYLCVSGSNASFKGSDGAPLMGLDQRSRQATPSFIARTASWDPFIVYIVDVNRPGGGMDAPPPPPPQPDYPSPPPNAIPFTNNGSQIPIYYNQTVVLQCLTSGVVSPVLIIRKVDRQTTVVGGGLQEGAKGVADHYCAPGEVCGDPVSQLHKIAFEVFDAGKGMPEPGTPGVSGAFLSCMGEKVNTYRPIDGRQWNATAPPPVPTTNGTDTGANSPNIPGSPMSPTVASATSEYFSSTPLDSAPASPSSTDFGSNDGGRVKKKRSTSSAGGLAKAVNAKGRRRPSSAGSVSSRRGSGSDSGAGSGALWQVDIGETAVWTIVGTDQVRYNFYVPPFLFDNQHAPPSPLGAFPIPSKPITPFPAVVKYLPPDRASEAPKSNCAQSRAVLAKPNPHAAKMLTVYGENFSKTDPVHVFFGSEPSPFVEVRCTEVLGCLPPESGHNGKRRPLVLVRSDGIVFPSNVMYP